MKTYEEIKQRILDNTVIDIDKREGSFTSNMVSPLALEVANAYENQTELVDMAFVRNGKLNYLDLKCEEYGIYRKLGVKSKGIAMAKGVNDTVIPKDTVLYIDDLLFKVLDTYTINAVGIEIGIEALGVGKEYNLLASTELSLQEDIQGVESIIVKEDINNGVDVETDEELKDRYFNTIKKSYTSGNVAHYEQWTMEVDGVGGCKVYPLKNGNGTVEVVIVNRDMLSASTDLINSVKANIEDNRPIGANVTVISATEKAINVSANIVLANGYSLDQVKEEYLIKLTSYLKEISFKTSYVSVARLGNLLLDVNGIFDYTDFKVNNGTTNIALTDIEVPKVGTFSFVEV